MGWLYYAATKKALIADRTTVWDTDGVCGTTLAFCVRGNRLWKVVEIEYHKEGTKERYIALDLLACHGRWGYKDLYEAEHPFTSTVRSGISPRCRSSARSGAKGYMLTMRVFIAALRLGNGSYLAVRGSPGCGSYRSDRSGASIAVASTAYRDSSSERCFRRARHERRVEVHQGSR